MIKDWLSRYNLRYPRSLVYMLQASEYGWRDYLAWFHRAGNFTRIEKRQRLAPTAKAVSLLVVAWILVALIIAAAIYILLLEIGPYRYLLFGLVLIFAPHLLAYGLVIPVLALQWIVQRPAEYFIVRSARERLKSHPAFKIGIAGSFGKTTMRETLKTVLSAGKRVAAPPHNHNTPLGISRFINTLSGDEEVLVFELGEYFVGDIRQLCDLTQVGLGVITGINEAHLEKFKSLDRTAAAIYELADHLAGKTVYVNGENPLARQRVRAGHIIYSRERVGDWKISEARTDLSGTSFVMTRGAERLELKSALLGLHQVGPLAAAADIALNLGLSLAQVREGIGRTKPFDHRFEPKTDSAGVITLDDSYNGNPDGVQAVIDFLASLSGHRRFYVTPGLVEMGERTAAVHEQIGRRLAQAGIEKVILVKNSVTPHIAAGLKAAGYRGDLMWFDDALAAFAALPQLTAAGDVVLLQNDWPDQYR